MPYFLKTTNVSRRSQFQSHLWHFVEKFIDRGYKKTEIYDSVSKTFDRNTDNLVTQNNKPKYSAPLTLTCNHTLPNVKEAVKKHWNILSINVFLEPPIMCFRRNKNLNDILWMKTIVNNKAQKVKSSNRKRSSIPCQSKTRNLCCKRVKHTNTS